MKQLVLSTRVHSPLKSIFLQLVPVTSIFNEDFSFDLKLSIFFLFLRFPFGGRVFLNSRRIFVTFFFHHIWNIFFIIREFPYILNRNTFSLVLALFHYFEPISMILYLFCNILHTSYPYPSHTSYPFCWPKQLHYLKIKRPEKRFKLEK